MLNYAGDNVIVGSKEGKLCWFDMDLSSKPYKTLRSVILDQIFYLIIIYRQFSDAEHF